MYVYIFIFVLLVVAFYLLDVQENFKVISLPKKYKIRREDCLDYCNKKDCLKMFDMQKDLDECRECNLKGRCFRKSIIGGVCEICYNGVDYIDCNLTSKFGCQNPENILNFSGVDPYYVIVDDDNSYSYTNKCKFCWNI